MRGGVARALLVGAAAEDVDVDVFGQTSSVVLAVRLREAPASEPGHQFRLFLGVIDSLTC